MKRGDRVLPKGRENGKKTQIGFDGGREGRAIREIVYPIIVGGNLWYRRERGENIQGKKGHKG